MENKKTLYFRKNGFYVEFKESSGEFIGYLLRRLMAFLIDVFIFAIVAVIIYFISGINIVLTSIIVWILLTFYVWSSSVMLQDRTVGMYLTKLNFVNYDGRRLSKNRRAFKLGIRAIVWSAMVVMPFINVAYFAFCMLSTFFVRSHFPVDYVSRTQIVTRDAYFHVEKVMREWDEN